MPAAILLEVCANSSRARTVPVARCAMGSIAFPVVLADANRLSPRMSGLDQDEIASLWPVVLPDVLNPDRLMPQLGNPVRLTSGPTKPLSTPMVQCWQSRTAIRRVSPHHRSPRGAFAIDNLRRFLRLALLPV